MKDSEHYNYNRIAAAIDYIKQNFKDQPSLEDIARNVNLSPFHFQRLFTDWAGVSPKKFLQYISVGHAKQLLRDKQATLFDAVQETGLSGTGRLHDLFISIEGMTPGEFKNGGEALTIHYSYAETPFGNIIVASTTKGVCYMAFEENARKALNDLEQYFPKAALRPMADAIQQNALSIFTQEWTTLPQVKLHLKGTDFQLKVWETLLKIPMGGLRTYGSIARHITQPNASRAVGTAIGSNPVAFLIPCHRVIQSTGNIGGYMWGPTRKTAMIGWEAARVGEFIKEGI